MVNGVLKKGGGVLRVGKTALTPVSKEKCTYIYIHIKETWHNVLDIIIRNRMRISLGQEDVEDCFQSAFWLQGRLVDGRATTVNRWVLQGAR